MKPSSLSLHFLLFLVGSSLSGFVESQSYKSIEMRLEEEAAAAAATACTKNTDCPDSHVCQDDGDGYRLKGDQACMGACSCVPGKREKATDSYMQSRGDKYMSGSGDKYMKRKPAGGTDKYMNSRGDKYMKRGGAGL